jgi:hypothetical protein
VHGRVDHHANQALECSALSLRQPVEAVDYGACGEAIGGGYAGGSQAARRSLGRVRARGLPQSLSIETTQHHRRLRGVTGFP